MLADQIPHRLRTGAPTLSYRSPLSTRDAERGAICWLGTYLQPAITALASFAYWANSIRSAAMT